MTSLQGMVENILSGGRGTTELLQSYVRCDDSEEDEDEKSSRDKTADSKKKGTGEATIGIVQNKSVIGALMTSSAPKRDIYSPIRKDSGSNDIDVEKIESVVISEQKPTKKATGGGKGKRMKRKKIRNRKKKVPRCEELYTDKDRAAAVNLGTKDIKQSLSQKQIQDRSKELQVPEEADSGTFLALGNHKMKRGDAHIAKEFFNKALELNPNDKEVLLARSRCNIQLGNAEQALEDASLVLEKNKNSIAAIYQKAEALYNIGQFEHSLVYYHRGLRIRPEQNKFRLGVQKAQKAIINTIGPTVKLAPVPHYCDQSSKLSSMRDDHLKSTITTPEPTPKSITTEKSRPSVSLLEGLRRHRTKSMSKSLQSLATLQTDKIYLEKLLRHPDIVCLDRDSNLVKSKAEEALQYLESRQYFWKQQMPKNVILK